MENQPPHQENQPPQEESGQQPEEQQPEAVVKDSDRARKDAHENPGVPGEGGQATGNPANAG